MGGSLMTHTLRKELPKSPRFAVSTGPCASAPHSKRFEWREAAFMALFCSPAHTMSQVHFAVPAV